MNPIHISLLVVLVISSSRAVSQAEGNELRKIEALHKPQRDDINGLLTYRAIPTSTATMEKMDPFIFLNHHGPQVFPANNSGLPFGPHPHKGFETVTFILDGDLVHRDNTGHESAITSGGMQWMTAGRGIVHSELSSEKFKKEGGNVEILQLWVNLPSHLKNAKPQYIGAQKDEIPAIAMDEGRVTVNLISGNFGKTKAPVQSMTDVLMGTIEMQKGGRFSVDVPEDRQIFCYIVKGAVAINGKKAGGLTLVEFAPEGERIEISADTETVILFGHAKPNNEPIVAKGPFVMNTQAEIEQAYEDYRAGKFGE